MTESMNCTKCHTNNPILGKYAYMEDDSMKHVRLCSMCTKAYSQEINLLEEFLKDDFGSFPISKVSRDMINARIARSKGEGAWQKVDN